MAIVLMAFGLLRTDSAPFSSTLCAGRARAKLESSHAPPSSSCRSGAASPRASPRRRGASQQQLRRRFHDLPRYFSRVVRNSSYRSMHEKKKCSEWRLSGQTGALSPAGCGAVGRRTSLLPIKTRLIEKACCGEHFAASVWQTVKERLARVGWENAGEKRVTLSVGVRQEVEAEILRVVPPPRICGLGTSHFDSTSTHSSPLHRVHVEEGREVVNSSQFVPFQDKNSRSTKLLYMQS